MLERKQRSTVPDYSEIRQQQMQGGSGEHFLYDLRKGRTIRYNVNSESEFLQSQILYFNSYKIE